MEKMLSNLFSIYIFILSLVFRMLIWIYDQIFLIMIENLRKCLQK